MLRNNRAESDPSLLAMLYMSRLRLRDVELNVGAGSLKAPISHLEHIPITPNPLTRERVGCHRILRMKGDHP